jgi:hypothetical protein
MINVIIKLVGIVLLSSCSTRYNSLLIIDNSLNPVGSKNQLVLARDRGELGHYSYAGTGVGSLEDFRWSGSGAKEWVITHWGRPDSSYTKGGIEYLIYEKRSKSAPNYSSQYLGGERLVKLRYKNAKLRSIEAFFRNCPIYMKGPVYILPK